MLTAEAAARRPAQSRRAGVDRRGEVARPEKPRVRVGEIDESSPRRAARCHGNRFRGHGVAGVSSRVHRGSGCGGRALASTSARHAHCHVVATRRQDTTRPARHNALPPAPRPVEPPPWPSRAHVLAGDARARAALKAIVGMAVGFLIQ